MKRIQMHGNAAAETNQIFWKVALDGLVEVGGPQAAATAEKFRLKKTIPSDRTAFPDDANTQNEIDALINKVRGTQ